MSHDESRTLRRSIKRPLSLPPADPIDAAYEAAADARDIIRDEQRRRELPSYTGDDEITANVHVTVNVPQAAPSQPDLNLEADFELGPVKVRGVPRWIGVGIALLVAGVTAFIAARLGGH